MLPLPFSYIAQNASLFDWEHIQVELKSNTSIILYPSPSTIIVAFDIPKPSLEQPTKEQLFLDVILLIVKLAGLADGDVSDVLTCGKKTRKSYTSRKGCNAAFNFQV